MRLNLHQAAALMAGIQNQFRRIVEWIGRRPPRAWGTCYILLIPLAGSVFWMLPPGSFYDSNLTREPGFKHDISMLAPALSLAIRRQEYGELTGGELPNPAWNAYGIKMVLGRSTVNVPLDSLNMDAAGNIIFVIQGWGHSSSPSAAYAVGNFGDLVAMGTAQPSFVFSRSGVPLLAGYAVTFAASPVASHGQIPLNILLPGAGRATAINPDASEIWLPPRMANSIQHLSAASQGDPKQASGSFWRMCYFSAVTVTTLGFGDITPVTTSARLIVGTEAVLGVVLIGLFLNAIARKWQE